MHLNQEPHSPKYPEDVNFFFMYILRICIHPQEDIPPGTRNQEPHSPKYPEDVNLFFMYTQNLYPSAGRRPSNQAVDGMADTSVASSLETMHAHVS